MNGDLIFLVVFGLVAAGLFYMVIRNRGWKGALFGAPLRKQVSEMTLARGRMMKTKVKVHVLDPRDPAEGPHVGIEIVQTTFGSWEMRPVALTRSEAQKLARDLQLAAEDSAAPLRSRG